MNTWTWTETERDEIWMDSREMRSIRHEDSVRGNMRETVMMIDGRMDV